MGAEGYVELKLEGSSAQAVGFVDGFRAALGDTRPVWCSATTRIALETLVERLRDRMHLECHFVLPRDLAEGVVQALAQGASAVLKATPMLALETAELDFDYRCFNPDDGAALRRLVEEELPAGVRLEGYTVDEQRDEAARGVELYAQAHHYILKGKGTYVGPVTAVLALAGRLQDQPFLHPGKVGLHRP